MKKLFVKIRADIQAKIDQYVAKRATELMDTAVLDKPVISRFQTIMPKAIIESLYKKVATDDLILTTKVIDVKKGKIKYTLLVVKSKDAKIIFYLDRHFQNEPVISARE